MKDFAIILLCELPSIVCFGGAAAILLNGGTEGWGWLLVAGCLALNSVDIKRTRKSQ